MWEPELYVIFQEDGIPKEHTYDQIVELVVNNDLNHNSSIKKMSANYWTKLGILMEFREALKNQIKNNH